MKNNIAMENAFHSIPLHIFFSFGITTRCASGVSADSNNRYCSLNFYTILLVFFRFVCIWIERKPLGAISHIKRTTHLIKFY